MQSPRTGEASHGERRFLETSGGTYLIALASDIDGTSTTPAAPIDPEQVQGLLETRQELTVDGNRPSVEDLEKRLALMWLPDESVVYIGKATNLSSRVSQYYATRLGARSPHAGGWPLKVLTNLDELWVHWATSPMPELAEQKDLAGFVGRVSTTGRSGLVDAGHPDPYANLEGPGGRKRHGIRGAREPRANSTTTEREATAEPPTTGASAPTSSSQLHTVSGGSPGRVTLHEEIISILRENGNKWMTTMEIAEQVAERKVYVKKNGTSDVTPFQTHGRTKNYPHLFECNGTRVRLGGP